MDNKETSPNSPDTEAEIDASASTADQRDSADALNMTPEELEEERAAKAAADTDLSALDGDLPEKKLPAWKRFWRKVNIYLLLFILVVILAAVGAFIMYLTSQKEPETPTVGSQTLTTDALKQLANTDTSVGNTSQTLTIKGNAVIDGQTLTRGNLNVAGNLQTGGSIQAPSLTISGTSNLGTAQINSLQVANTLAVQGASTMRDLTVAGTASFGGAVTAPQLTVSRLILSGNATLEIPNHVSFTGPSPGGAPNYGVLGGGGSATVGGSDTAGTINGSTGNGPSAGCFIRVTFQQSFSKQPHVVVSPVGSAAGQMQFYVERNNASFSVCSANTPPANQPFAFDYFVTY